MSIVLFILLFIAVVSGNFGIFTTFTRLPIVSLIFACVLIPVFSPANLPILDPNVLELELITPAILLLGKYPPTAAPIFYPAICPILDPTYPPTFSPILLFKTESVIEPNFSFNPPIFPPVF